MRFISLLSLLFIFFCFNAQAKGLGKDDLEHLFQTFLKSESVFPKKTFDSSFNLMGDLEEYSKKEVLEAKTAEYQLQIANKKKLLVKRKGLEKFIKDYNRFIRFEKKLNIASDNIKELEQMTKEFEQSRDDDSSQAEFRLIFSYIEEAENYKRQLNDHLRRVEQTLSAKYQNKAELIVALKKTDFTIPEKNRVIELSRQQHADLSIKREQLKFAEYLGEKVKVAGLTAYIAAAEKEISFLVDDLYDTYSKQADLTNTLQNKVSRQVEYRNNIYQEYKNDVKSLSDVLTAQKALVAQQFEFTHSDHNYNESSLLIALATGQLDDLIMIDNNNFASTAKIADSIQNRAAATHEKQNVETQKTIELKEEISVPEVLAKKLILYNQPNALRLTKESQNMLNEFVSEAVKFDKAKVQVRGYIASKNDSEENRKLSEKRAMNVKKMMVKLGLADQQIEAIGMSNKNPIASNKNRAGRAKNRRVEVTVILQ